MSELVAIAPTSPETSPNTINLLPPFPEVIDSSIRSAYVSCARQWYYGYLLGLRKPGPSIHLHFGGCVAKGIEITRRSFYVQHKTEIEAVADGCKALIKQWGDFELPTDIERSRAGVKTLDAALDALVSYFENYQLSNDIVKPLMIAGEAMIEKSFALPIPGTSHPITGNPVIYAGRFDMIGEFNETNFVVDEKTTLSLGTTWASNWPLRGQLTGYCLTPDHEVLTPNGWIPIWQITTDHEVAQWQDGKVNFVKPINVFSPDFRGELVSLSGKISLTGTPEHRQPFFNRWTNTRETFPLQEIAYSKNGSYRYYTAGQYVSGKIKDKEFARFLVAVQADGSLTRPPNIRFSLVKERKKERLEELLDALEIDYERHDSGTRSDYTLSGLDNFVIKARQLLGRYRLWDKWLLEYDNETLNTWIDELKYWDGSDRNTRGSLYFTTELQNVEWVRTVAALTGHYTSVHTQQIHSWHKIAYRVNITNEPLVSVFGHIISRIPWDSKVYCIEVPSSYFLVRHHDRISVTGNCWGARSFGLDIAGCIIRGLGILKQSIQFQQAVLTRPKWMIDAWLRQLSRDVNHMCEMWIRANNDMRQGLLMPHLAFDQAFDSACSAYGGCGFVPLCEAQDPRHWYGDYVQHHWNPLQRDGDAA